LVAAYWHDRGKIILSTLQLEENLDAHPATDRLLLNLIRRAQRQVDQWAGGWEVERYEGQF